MCHILLQEKLLLQSQHRFLSIVSDPTRGWVSFSYQTQPQIQAKTQSKNEPNTTKSDTRARNFWRLYSNLNPFDLILFVILKKLNSRISLRLPPLNRSTRRHSRTTRRTILHRAHQPLRRTCSRRRRRLLLLRMGRRKSMPNPRVRWGAISDW